MVPSITTTLYLWLKEKRLTEAIAKRMGKPPSTLAAELQGAKNRFKLGADELIPLFNAIRATDYANEFAGILKKYLRELGGEECEAVSAEQFSSLLFQVMQGIATLSQSADHIENLETIGELSRLKTKIRAEIVPAVYQLEAIVDDQMKRLRQKKASSRKSVIQPQLGNEGA